MNRFHFGIGLVLALVGLATTIVLGITKPESYTQWGFGIISIVIGSFLIAYAFPEAP